MNSGDYENWPGGELPYGWAGECGDFNFNEKIFNQHRYEELITWILCNVHNPRNNVHWKYIGGKTFRFRKKKDMLLFTLRWL